MSSPSAKEKKSDSPPAIWEWRPQEIFCALALALRLVYRTSPRLFSAYASFTLVLGVLPPAIAYCAQGLVDSVVAGSSTYAQAPRAALELCLGWLLAEAVLVFVQDGSSRVLRACQAVLRGLLGQRVHLQILEKAIDLELPYFEDSEFYDKLTRARRGASTRPLSLVDRSCTLIQRSITLVGSVALLFEFSPYAIALVVASVIPSFFAQTKYSADVFQFFSLKSEDTRKQYYFETVLTQDRFAKEVKLFGLGEFFLARYRAVFDEIFDRERSLILRREFWLFVWGRFRFFGVYFGYAWVMYRALQGLLSLGEMTMYWLLLKQGQNAVRDMLQAVGAIYEDHLYLSTLQDFLAQPKQFKDGEHKVGIDATLGLEFREVEFSYPGQERKVLSKVSFRIRPGESLALVGQNGAGKTTLIKLLTRLYRPCAGEILLDGRALGDWQHRALLHRIGVIFQDFNHYHLSAGLNIGTGDVERIDDREAWRVAADLGMARELIEELPEGYDTQLGRWFRKGHELSGGQWQKVALSRAMMRDAAKLLIFDEPTAAMDAESEMRVFEHIRQIGGRDKMLLLISHRFSTVRTADSIMVLEKGEIVERGTHAELMRAQGRYARLYSLQAKGFAGGEAKG